MLIFYLNEHWGQNTEKYLDTGDKDALATKQGAELLRVFEMRPRPVEAAAPKDASWSGGMTSEF